MATRRAALAALAAAPLGAAAAGGNEPGVPASHLAALERGFNLPSWFGSADGRAPDFAALRSLREAGFTHVRLPVAPELFIGEIAGADAAGRRFADLLRAFDRLIGLDFAVVLDMHPGHEIGRLRRDDPAVAFRHLLGLWVRFAGSLADRPPGRLMFEMLNEPSTIAEWREAIGLAALVRSLAPHHTLVLGPPNAQRVEALEAVTPIADRNVVYAIHVYDPMPFTHQGADWDGPDRPIRFFEGVPFPSRPDHPAVLALEKRLRAAGHAAAADALSADLAKPFGEREVEAIIARAGAWSRRHAAPVIVNEFGVLSWKAPPADRARWIRTVRTAAERHGLGWTHWDYAEGFGFMHRTGGRELPDPEILAALVGR